MWHFGKGQAPHLGRPSIFITSPLVIWKLASPIFVSPSLLSRPASSQRPLFRSYLLPFILFSPLIRVALLSFCSSWFNNATPFRLTCHFREKKIRFHTQTQKENTCLRPRGCCGGLRDCMSTPAVRIVVTERRANTNVINTSALTPGTLCVSEFR